jgi:hypothetical protein
MSTGGNPRGIAKEYLQSVRTHVVDLLDREADSFAAGVAALELALGLRAHDGVRQLTSSDDYRLVRDGFADRGRATAKLVDRAVGRSLLSADRMPDAPSLAQDVVAHRRSLIAIAFDAGLEPTANELAEIPVSLSAAALTDFVCAPETRDRESPDSNVDPSVIKFFAFGSPVHPLKAFSKFDKDCRVLRRRIPQLTPADARVLVMNGHFSHSADSLISRGALRHARRRHPDVDPKDLKYFLVHCPSDFDDRIAAFADDKKLLVESGLPLNKHEIRTCARRRVGDVVAYATTYLQNVDTLCGEFPELRAHEAKPFAYQPIDNGRVAIAEYLHRVQRTMECNPALTRNMASKLSLMYRDYDEIKVAARERTK